jgi:hypothetical protein
MPVVDAFDVAQIDQALGTTGTGQMRDENVFFEETWTIAIDHGVFFGVQAAAVANFVAIALIWQSGRVSVVPDGKYFAKVGAGDHCTDLEPGAGGALRQQKSQAHVYGFKTWAIILDF